MSERETPIIVFWSWQSDSDSKVNRNFVADCIERAARALRREDSIVINLDRDTKGVGGSPSIVDTIFSKICASDVFIWDATLVTKKPRPSPNPNVLVEYGYALATLGERRLIGVMNTESKISELDIPFDLRHKRFPIVYSLQPETPLEELVASGELGDMPGFGDRRETAREMLVQDLKTAIRDALKEPRDGALQNDHDLIAVQNLKSQIDSEWLHDWYVERSTMSHEESRKYINVLANYCRASERPENQFQSDQLREVHRTLTDNIGKYLHDTSVEMIPVNANREGVYQISTKVDGRRSYMENYAEEYDRQVGVVLQGLEAVWTAWEAYVKTVQRRYGSFRIAKTGEN